MNFKCAYTNTNKWEQYKYFFDKAVQKRLAFYMEKQGLHDRDIKLP